MVQIKNIIDEALPFPPGALLPIREGFSAGQMDCYVLDKFVEGSQLFPDFCSQHVRVVVLRDHDHSAETTWKTNDGKVLTAETRCFGLSGG